MYPQLKINLAKIKHNTDALVNLLKSRCVSAAIVTKVHCADPRIVETICQSDIGYLADSRLENIESYQKKGIPTMLLRLPSPSEAGRVVRSCNVSLNSEITTLSALSRAAKEAGLKHNVVLMVDLGDLREGVYYKSHELLYKTVEYALSKKHLELVGIGVNLTCYGSVLPTRQNLGTLVDISKKIKEDYGADLKIISGGNSSSLYLFESGQLPEGINNLRLGESVLLGFETAYGRHFSAFERDGISFPGLKLDAVILEAEVIEIMEKPSYPEGELGVNAFGEKMHYEDHGMRIRAILAVGRQDTDQDGLECLDPQVRIVGSSSDHLLVDVTESERAYHVGSVLGFRLSYGALLAGFTSRYVKRVYV